jgi:hypothetical protein
MPRELLAAEMELTTHEASIHIRVAERLKEEKGVSHEAEFNTGETDLEPIRG